VKKSTRTVVIDNTEIPYKLIKRKRHYSFTLSVHAGGRVTLTVPKRISDKLAERYMLQKRRWLKQAIESAPKRKGFSNVNREHYRTHKEKARMLVLTRLSELNVYYGFVYKNVYIRANTSRWGSCSGHGNLNFDYRILFLPAHLQDYILVHELCHLKEMNHSKRFWNLVAQAVPDYVVRQKALRKKEI
jgi:predicted metal-dependent hydrolase